jgi:endo-1,4-beta-xylanase
MTRPLSIPLSVLALSIACGSDAGGGATPPEFHGTPASPTPSVGAAGSGELPVDDGTSPTPIGEGLDEDVPLDPGASEPDPDGEATLPDGTPVDPPPVEPPGPATTLREAGALSNRLVGVALANYKLGRAGYGDAAKQFSVVTPENELKWNATEPQPGVFTFEAGDRVVEFAEANGMAVRGHTLVWHSQLADWARQLTTRDAALAAMERHITTLVGRYRGRIHAWDVVNEAFTDGQSPRLRGSLETDATDAANQGNNGPDSVFRRLIGADYIDRAFQLARAADPDALLFYNDYNAEGSSAKANAVFAMVESMVERGIPIDGVGLQMHITATADNGRSAAAIAENIRRLAALGLQVHITELDVTLCGNGSIEQRREQQRQRFAEVIDACTAEPSCTDITIWGVADQDSWRNSDCNGGGSEPLLFGNDYQPKALAYGAVFDALLRAGGQ